MNIGKYTYVSGKTNITAPVVMGNFTSIAPDVEMHNLPQHASIVNRAVVCNFSMSKFGADFPKPEATEKTITIGSDVWVGKGAVLLDGITVGDGAIIGAYAVVKRDVQPYEIVIGNPAEHLKFRFTTGEIAELLKIKWWDWPEEKIKECIDDFKNVTDFIIKHRA